VRQENAHLPTQTLREAVVFSALMRLPAAESMKEKAQFAERVLVEVGLQHAADLSVGTLGESRVAISDTLRKQLSLAVEMAMNPSLLLADDPVAGFDFASSKAILGNLSTLAHNGCAVIVAMQQPSLYQLSQVNAAHILVENGRTLYHGPVTKLLEFCRRQKFVQTAMSLGVIDTPPLTDHGALLTLLKMDHLRLFRFQPEFLRRSESGTFLIEGDPVEEKPLHEYRNRHAFDRALLEDTDPPLGFATQTWILLGRFLRMFSRNEEFGKFRIALATIQALVLGWLLWQGPYDATKVMQVFALCMIVSVMLALMFSLELVPILGSEIPTFHQETSSAMYSPVAYFLARMVAQTPWLIVNVILFGVIAYKMINLMGGYPFASFLACLWCGLSFADCIVIICSLVSSTQETAAMHYTITSILLLLLSGAVIFTNAGLMFPRGMPAGMKELNVIDPFRYPFSIAAIDQFYDAEFDVLEQCITLAGDTANALSPDGIGDVNAVFGAEVETICAPKVPGSFILEWVFCIDADQKMFFWAMAISFFVLLHIVVLVVAKLSVLERGNKWLSFAATNGISRLWRKYKSQEQ
jgi:energy-coupling factor transporter ATP-binding protein EcfA2